MIQLALQIAAFLFIAIAVIAGVSIIIWLISNLYVWIIGQITKDNISDQLDD